MSKVTSHEPGMLCWTELGTPETASAKAFYTKLFGWSVNEIPMPEGEPYYMFGIGGDEVAAMYAMSAEQQGQGVPPHWATYFAVANVDESTDRARSLGGTVLAGPFDVFDSGRMSMIQDPTGAVLGLWQAGKHIGARRFHEHGALDWAELMTSDPDKAGAFYAQLFDWEAQRQQVQDVLYTVFLGGGRPAAGMVQLPQELRDVPSNWMVYFNVSDCDAVVEAARKDGATIMAGPQDVPEVGRFAIMQDAQGAVYGVIRPVDVPVAP